MGLALQYLELITTSSRSFAAGAAKMASSKQTAGSEPEQEKKAEASADSGKPFEFFWVSAFYCPMYKISLDTESGPGAAERNLLCLVCDAKAVSLIYGVGNIVSYGCTVKLLCSCMTIQT